MRPSRHLHHPLSCVLIAAGGLGLMGCQSHGGSSWSIPRDAYDVPLPGPTLMSKVPGGYELRNRWTRVVIDEKTGDILFWAPAGATRNLLPHEGIEALPDQPLDQKPDGYVEARDEQTWQYLGEDASHIAWRKIYSLDGRALHASFLMQNNTTQTLSAIEPRLWAEFASLRIDTHDGQLFEGSTSTTAVRVRAFVERSGPASATLPVILVGDKQPLKPGQRISLTTEWELDTDR